MVAGFLRAGGAVRAARPRVRRHRNFAGPPVDGVDARVLPGCAYPRVFHRWEICAAQVFDDSLVATAIHFEHTHLRTAQVSLNAHSGSEEAEEFLAQALPHAVGNETGGAQEKLVDVRSLVRGLMRHLPKGVALTGGLAGDGARFGETLVSKGDIPQKGVIAAVGLYGSHLKVGVGSLGGWDPFGPERLVTRSKGNVLFELDGRPALGLYIPEGALARLTKSNVDRLVDGAVGAARASYPAWQHCSRLAVLISCVGRKLVLKQRVEDEVEGVRSILGEQVAMTGFYSYDEIAPFAIGERSELHNQTMTITTFAES
jgi:hypothetical protein